MIKNILLLAGIITLGCLRFFLRHYQADLIVARTGTFVLLILMELLVIQIIRADYGVKFWSNKWLFLAIGGSVVLTLLLMYIPALAEIFNITPLSFIMRLEIIGVLAALSIGSRIYQYFKKKKMKQ